MKISPEVMAAPDSCTTPDLFEVECANRRAAICQQLPTTWLSNGREGKTLPRELAEAGYHIWFREELPPRLQ